MNRVCFAVLGRIRDREKKPTNKYVLVNCAPATTFGTSMSRLTHSLISNTPFRSSLLRFFRMFDLIAGAPPAPHYPTERPPHPRPQSTSYGGRRVPDTDAIHASLHRSPPSQLPPSRAVVDDGEDPHSLGHFNGQSGVPVILPCGCTGKWPPGGPATNPS